MKSLALTLVFWATTTTVFQASAQSASPLSFQCTTCGFTHDLAIPAFPGMTFTIYNFSAQEMAGTCKRENVHYTGQPTLSIGSTIPAECTCVKTECETCIKNKTKADVDSCCGSGQAFTYNSLSFEFLSQSTKKPTCCRAEGTNSTGGLTSACFCEAATTECFKSASLCPAPPGTKTRRMYGGGSVTPCGTDVIRFSSNSLMFCNAVYAHNPSGTDNTGAQLTTPVVYVPKNCMTIIDIQLKHNKIIQVTVGNTTFPYKADEVTRKQLGNANFEALTFNKYTGPCMDKPVCTYNKATMAAAIDKKDCYLLSFGDDTTNAFRPGNSGSLNKVLIYKVESPTPCKDAFGTAAECFFPKNVGAHSCSNDIGAPVFCPLKETAEPVLYGSFARTGKCTQNDKIFPIIPIN